MNLGLISEISADGQTKRVIAETGRPNGLTLDAAGFLWVAGIFSITCVRQNANETLL
jgi:sugar lactone lactonase YvrE